MKRRRPARASKKQLAKAKEEASATRLIVKMESTGLSAKQLLAKGLTTNRQIMALRRCEYRWEQEQRKAAQEEAEANEKKAKQEKAMAAMASGS